MNPGRGEQKVANDPAIATGAGHHSVLKLPGTEDDWVICYHRRVLGETNKFHRVVCLDKIKFRAHGSIAPVTLTHTGVPAHPVPARLKRQANTRMERCARISSVS